MDPNFIEGVFGSGIGSIGWTLVGLVGITEPKSKLFENKKEFCCVLEIEEIPKSLSNRCNQLLCSPILSQNSPTSSITSSQPRCKHGRALRCSALMLWPVGLDGNRHVRQASRGEHSCWLVDVDRVGYGYGYGWFISLKKEQQKGPAIIGWLVDVDD